MSKHPIPDLSIPEIETLIDSWIFSQRDRAILKRRIIDNITFDELSAEFYLSPQRIKTIVYKSEEIIYRHV